MSSCWSFIRFENDVKIHGMTKHVRGCVLKQNHCMLMTARKRQFSIILIVQCRAGERDNFKDCRIDTKCTFFSTNICGKKKHFMLLTSVIVT